MMHITHAFLEGMQSASPRVIHIIDVIDKHIEYCTGCFACKRNGGNCIHDDDMREILKEILESDLLLFSFRLYSYGMPAPLKALLDRTMPLSSKAMRKVGDCPVGMRREGLFMELVSFVNQSDGTPLYENTVQYAILKKEWGERKCSS